MKHDGEHEREHVGRRSLYEYYGCWLLVLEEGAAQSEENCALYHLNFRILSTYPDLVK